MGVGGRHWGPFLLPSLLLSGAPTCHLCTWVSPLEDKHPPRQPGGMTGRGVLPGGLAFDPQCLPLHGTDVDPLPPETPRAGGTQGSIYGPGAGAERAAAGNCPQVAWPESAWWGALGFRPQPPNVSPPHWARDGGSSAFPALALPPASLGCWNWSPGSRPGLPTQQGARRPMPSCPAMPAGRCWSGEPTGQS